MVLLQFALEPTGDTPITMATVSKSFPEDRTGHCHSHSTMAPVLLLLGKDHSRTLSENSYLSPEFTPKLQDQGPTTKTGR